MAAVPTGPSGALPASPVEIIPFPGDGCAGPGEGEKRVIKKESVISNVGKEGDISECKRERENNQRYLFSEIHPHCPTLDRQVNGLNCFGVDGFTQNYEDGSLEELRLVMDHCDKHIGVAKNNSNSVQNNNDREQRDHRLRFPCYDMNTNSDSSIHGVLKLSRTDGSPSHSSIGDEIGSKNSSVIAECCPRPDERPGVISQTGADVPLEELSRLDLNHSFLRETRRSEEINYVRYESELQMPGIMRLITKDLSEPYSIYTYRYFIHNWPQLCFLAMVEEECVGAIVCKLDMHKKMFRRGYIAMLAVDSKHRRKSIGTNLVKKAIYAMVEGDCDEVVLETEITNKSALKLYENLGFVRDKRLFRYYLNGVDALRLKLWLR
ncbi:uncharacterized protein LOC113569783 [Electrophorus electricus]|uniref:N-alpha-acetyltransferase 30 n=1 Tax=Electrophorus electricus TaxID=8005 RepID=A0A4W4FLY3_ELEEL|nr:uncharacterized protein LOC113569783 [Electrophorus electricus]